MLVFLVRQNFAEKRRTRGQDHLVGLDDVRAIVTAERDVEKLGIFTQFSETCTDVRLEVVPSGKEKDRKNAAIFLVKFGFFFTHRRQKLSDDPMMIALDLTIRMRFQLFGSPKFLKIRNKSVIT